MTFEADKIESFLDIFSSNKSAIRNFDGCTFLELYQDIREKNIFFTYSYWNSEKELENYRKSELFNTVWSKTKVLFCDKPDAWSVQKIISLS